MKEEARYMAEIRVFEQAPSDVVPMDYVSETASGESAEEALDEAYYIAKRLGEDRVKINVLDMEHPEHGCWCIHSKIINMARWANKEP